MRVSASDARGPAPSCTPGAPRARLCHAGARLDSLEGMTRLLRGDDRDLLVEAHIAERKAHGKAVHLRFGQRISAAELHGVLCGDDEEQIVHLRGPAFDTHL